MKDLKGEVSISRIYGGEEDSIRIRTIDSSSGNVILDAAMSLSKFAEVLTGTASVACSIRYFDQSNIGKKRIAKDEIVPYTSTHKRNSQEEQVDKELAVAPFEIDGWKCAGLSDLGNPYREHGGLGYKVLFLKYVDE